MGSINFEIFLTEILTKIYLYGMEIVGFFAAKDLNHTLMNVNPFDDVILLLEIQ